MLCFALPSEWRRLRKNLCWLTGVGGESLEFLGTSREQNLQQLLLCFVPRWGKSSRYHRKFTRHKSGTLDEGEPVTHFEEGGFTFFLFLCFVVLVWLVSLMFLRLSYLSTLGWRTLVRVTILDCLGFWHSKKSLKSFQRSDFQCRSKLTCHCASRCRITSNAETWTKLETKHH